MFHGCISYNVLDLKLGNRPQKTPTPNSQVTQDVTEQTEIIFQDVRKNVMQAYIKYKAYYDKKAHASELNERDNVYVLQPKAGHQGNKIPLTDFQWTAPFFSPALTT